MENLKTSVLLDEHETIREIVTRYDQKAKVALFGPGTTRTGKSLDVYIYSQKIDRHLKGIIHDTLVNTYHINVDMVCMSTDAKNFETMKDIGLNLV
ncbi:MAG: hypothetical protein ACERKD_24750 [Prolixibacteraceae bacterium]